MVGKDNLKKLITENGKGIFQILCLIWIKLLVHAILIIIFHDYLESRKFYLDAEMMYTYYNSVMESSWLPFKIGDAYGNTAKFYRLMFFGADLSKEMFYLACSCLYAIVYHIAILQLPIKNKRKFFFFSMIFIFDAVYLFQPCKEITALILSILVIHQIQKDNKSRNLWILFELLIYALVFRIYYIILILFYLIYLIYCKNKKLAGGLILAGFVLFCILFQQGFMTHLLQGKIIVENANTELKDLFTKQQMSENVFLYLINYAVMVVRLIFPVEIIVKSPSSAVLFLPIYWYMLFEVARNLRQLWKKRGPGESFSTMMMNREDQKKLDVLVIICSHILMSAFFEPDLGSYLRHISGILPLYYFIMFQEPGNIKWGAGNYPFFRKNG